MEDYGVQCLTLGKVLQKELIGWFRLLHQDTFVCWELGIIVLCTHTQGRICLFELITISLRIKRNQLIFIPI